jgi:hypothetical protein
VNVRSTLDKPFTCIVHVETDKVVSVKPLQHPIPPAIEGFFFDLCSPSNGQWRVEIWAESELDARHILYEQLKKRRRQMGGTH